MATFLKANWEDIIMVNYEIDPEILQPFLPKGVSLDLYEGKAYVSLVGFMFKKAKLFNIPMPGLGTFEEINLRFYVQRKDGDKTKRGVVFVNETIPYRLVAWVANFLYKEHYTVVPTKHFIAQLEDKRQIRFEWLLNKKWNRILVETNPIANPMLPNSLEEFIYEHYYGYTKIDAKTTKEYHLRHPSWQVYKVLHEAIDCDFAAMYGEAFSVLNQTKPTAIFVAKGSSVEVDWQRTRLKFTDERH